MSKNAKLCALSYLRNELIGAYTGLTSLLDSNYFSSERVWAAFNSDQCDAVIISDIDYNRLSSKDTGTCGSYAILLETVVLSVNIVLPISPKLGILGDEFLLRLNRFIDREVFKKPIDDFLYEGRSTSPCGSYVIAEPRTIVPMYNIITPALISVVFCIVALWKFRRDRIQKRNEFIYNRNR